MYYSTVRETIDDFYGDAIMCYDHATASFAYYARTANIPYKYLETISRKYMIETNAPIEIHVDIRDEYNKAKDRNNTAAASASTPSASASTPAPAAAEETPDVFVKLKSYNTVSNLNLHTTTNDKSHKFATATSTATTSTPATTASTPATATPGNKIFREKANRYSYRGKITDFDGRAPAATPAATTPAATATPSTGYAEFKKQWKTTKSAL